MALFSLSEIHIRDPFVLPLPGSESYVLYGTTDATCWSGPGVGFDAYVSRDLAVWDGPHPAFRPPADFWGKENFWAPEVHAYAGRYYLFASFKAPGKARGTQILVADNPLGPFLPHSPTPITPPDWECLDGTLWVEPDGTPYLVFCHEWLQISDGTVCAIPLQPELSGSAGEPTVLFAASSAPWAASMGKSERQNYVTDGPFLFRLTSGQLAMLWSSFDANRSYCVAVARSEGGVLGPWRQDPTPLFAGGGGHAMLFSAFDGQRYLTLHAPNQQPYERAHLYPVSENAQGLFLPDDPLT